MEYTEEEVEQLSSIFKGRDNQDKLLKWCWSDLDDAIEAKREFECRITHCQKIIKGDLELFPAESGRSSIVVRDAQRQVKWGTAQLASPYLTEKKLVNIKTTAPGSNINTTAIEALLNHQLYKQMDYRDLVKKTTKAYIGEGIIVAKTVWRTKTKRKIEGTAKIRDEEEFEILRAKLSESGFDVLSSKKEEDHVEITYGSNVVISQNPDIEMIPFERFFPAPNSTKISGVDYDCDFVIEKNVMTLSQIKKEGKSKGWKNIDKLEAETKELRNSGRNNTGGPTTTESLNSTETSTLGDYRKRMMTGDKEVYNADAGRSRIDVYTKYGMHDPKENGDLIMCCIVWSGDVILYAEQSDYPDDSIPYIVTTFDPENFSLYGDIFTEYVEDSQKVRTALMRLYIDNAAYGNYGLGLIRKGLLGVDELQQLKDREFGDVIEVNGSPQDYVELTSQPIPAQHYSLYELWASESEAATGFTRLTQGQTNTNTPDSASGMSMAIKAGMQRINEYSDWYSHKFWQPVLRSMLLLNQYFLPETTFLEISGAKEVTISKDAIDMDLDIDVNINTTGENDAKVSRIQQVFNLTEALVSGNIVEPFVLRKLFIKLVEYLELSDISEFMEQSATTMPNGSKSIYEMLLSSGVPEDQAAQISEQLAEPVMAEAEQIGKEIQEEIQRDAQIQDTLQKQNEQDQLDAHAQKQAQKQEMNPSSVGKYVPPSEISNRVVNQAANAAGSENGVNGAVTNG